MWSPSRTAIEPFKSEVRRLSGRVGLLGKGSCRAEALAATKRTAASDVNKITGVGLWRPGREVRAFIRPHILRISGAGQYRGWQQRYWPAPEILRIRGRMK